jgi:putative hydrolase of the HAD superfamily
MTDLSHIEGIIWDLDDTLYSVTPALHTSMRESVARAVVKMGYPITFEDALVMAEESQEKHRLTVQMLVEKFDINTRDLHLPFHAEMDHNVITPCPDLPTIFAQNPQIKHTLMTHASREWGMRMLDHLGIADFFDSSAVFGLEDMDFEKKEVSDRATKTCLAAIGVNAENAAFAEDRDWNLTIPHGMGLTTVLIDHPSHAGKTFPHVHHNFENAGAFLTAINGGQARKTA